jgi:SAM-dependent methyltransferase
MTTAHDAACGSTHASSRPHPQPLTQPGQRTRSTLLRTHRLVSSVIGDPLRFLRRLRGIPAFVQHWASYSSRAPAPSFRIRFSEIWYSTSDQFAPAGSVRGHYFHQDLWAARMVRSLGVARHVDIASRLDGFVAHVLPFAEVEYVDIRPVDADVPGLTSRIGSVVDLPYADQSVVSLSCLHVIEHIGLGRYGDPIDPDGHVAAARELSRVLAPGGTLLIGTPVGRERLCFDAHRVFDPDTIVRIFGALRLRSFALIDDTGAGVRNDADFADARQCEYGCGLFVFERSAVP